MVYVTPCRKLYTLRLKVLKLPTARAPWWPLAMTSKSVLWAQRGHWPCPTPHRKLKKGSLQHLICGAEYVCLRSCQGLQQPAKIIWPWLPHFIQKMMLISFLQWATTALDPQEGSLKCRLAREYDHWPSTAIAGHNGTKPPSQGTKISPIFEIW